MRVRPACKVEAMEGNTASKRLYVELMAHLIDREIAKFRRGERAALVSFSNVAQLARNATDELTAAQARGPRDACPCPDLRHRSSRARRSGKGAVHGQVQKF
jgi:hypothetical protein